jgi:alpha-glucosidase
VDDAVLYQVYPRSFADSDGDGVGDLDGLRARLGHLSDLGVDAVWLSPIHPSPNVDWGYDVADYLDVAPDLGGMGAFERLASAAEARGIRILLDLVPNHTSNRHRWFREALGGRRSARRDWYVWADPQSDGGPPNNWESMFGGPAWTFDRSSGQCYLHNFAPEQPDLNWWNPEVGEEFRRILGFWFDRGVAGFRIDVCHAIVKDRLLRDDPRNERGEIVRVHSMNRPEVHGILADWRRLADAHPTRPVLLGETVVGDLTRLATYYGSADAPELHLAMNFPFLEAPFDADGLRAAIRSTLAILPGVGQPVWLASNHDRSRFPTRWCADALERVPAALMLILGLRGTPLLYFGDEIGMPDVSVTGSAVRDRLDGRDPSRTPMQWGPGPGAGFTRPGARPWLPLGDAARVNVSDQRGQAASPLEVARRMIGLRKHRAALRRAPVAFREAARGVLWLTRGPFDLLLNLAGTPAPRGCARGTVLVATDPALEGRRIEDHEELEPWAGVLVERS